MKSLLMGFAVLPIAAGVALAAQPLTNQQMDRVTAGFSASSIANATGTVGPGEYVLTATTSLAQVAPYATVTIGEITVTAYASTSRASSTTTTGSIP